MITREKLRDLKGHTGLVLIPTFNSTPTLGKLIETLIETLPEDFAILIIDDKSPNFKALIDAIEPICKISKKTIHIFRQEENLGFVGNVNTFFKETSGLDIILCNSDIVPARNWFPGLLAAAKSSRLVATATAVTNHGSIATVEFPEIKANLLENLNSLGNASQAERKVFPVLPTCVGHLVYMNATAIEAVGYFDEIFSPGYGEEVDWSQRAIGFGFRHVLAPESVVYHEGNVSFSEKLGVAQKLLKDKNDDVVVARFPNFSNMVETICAKDRSLVESSRLNFRRISGKLSLRIDLTFLTPLNLTTPTSQVALRTSSKILSLREFRKVEFVVSDEINVDDVAGHLGEFAEIVQSSLSYDLPRSDFVFRPMQILSKSDLIRLNEMGKRQIVWQYESTSYENPYFFENFQQWKSYRSLTELSFELMDGFMFLTEFIHEQFLLLGLFKENSFARQVIFLSESLAGVNSSVVLGSRKNYFGVPTFETGSMKAVDKYTMSTHQNELDELLSDFLEPSDSKLWNGLANKVVSFIGELARGDAATTKDVLWEIVFRDFENEIREDLEKQQVFEIQRQSEIADELHNLRLKNGALYRLRHSAFGNLLIPRGTYRDRILQKLFKSPSYLPS
jgi:GT2 family glycosyltransferase